jgi:hypothetical protein
MMMMTISLPGIQVCIIAFCLCLALYILGTENGTLFTGQPQGDTEFEWLQKTRDARQYILPNVNTTLLNSRTSCDDRLRLLILVASAPGNSEQRQAIRDTWGYTAPVHDARLIFFLGHDGIRWPLLATVSNGLPNVKFEIVRVSELRLYPLDYDTE